MRPIEVKVKNAVVKIYVKKRNKGGRIYQQFDVIDYSTGRRKFISFADEDGARKKAREIASDLGGKKGSVVTLEGAAASAYLRAIEDAIQRLSTKAGVPWKHNALRHSFISYRLAQVQNAAQVSLEAGNSPKMIFKHYRELVTPDQPFSEFSFSK